MSVQATLWQTNRVLCVNDLSLNTSDLSTNRKRKGKGVSETIRSGKARWWSDAEVYRSRAIFCRTNRKPRVCFLRILGRFWSQTLESKCCIKHVAFVWPPRSTLCNVVQQCWMMRMMYYARKWHRHPSMPVSLSRIIHHSHSFTRLEIYHHIYFIMLDDVAIVWSGLKMLYANSALSLHLYSTPWSSLDSIHV